MDLYNRRYNMYSLQVCGLQTPKPPLSLCWGLEGNHWVIPSGTNTCYAYVCAHTENIHTYQIIYIYIYIHSNVLFIHRFTKKKTWWWSFFLKTMINLSRSHSLPARNWEEIQTHNHTHTHTDKHTSLSPLKHQCCLKIAGHHSTQFSCA